MQKKAVLYGSCCLCCTCLWITLLVIALILPGFVGTIAQDAVKDYVPIKDEEVFEERFGGGIANNSWTYIVFNITNARDVQLGLAKPRFNEVEFKFATISKRYNVSFSGDRSEVSYAAWSKLEIQQEYSELYYNSSLVMINPLYAAGVYSRFGKESNLFKVYYPGLALTLRNLREQATEQVMPFLINTYLQGVIETIQTCISVPELALQWGGVSQGAAANCMGDDRLAGFEIADTPACWHLNMTGCVLPEAVIHFLWNTTNPLSLITSSGARTWRDCYLCASVDNEDECFNAPNPLAEVATKLGEVGDSNYTGKTLAIAVTMWVGSLMKNPSYLEMLKVAMDETIPEVNDAQSLDDITSIQFGTGKIIEYAWGEESVLPFLQSVRVFSPPELGVYARRLNEPVTESASMTVAQANAFFTKFMDAEICTAFFGAVDDLDAGDSTALKQVLSNLSDTGLYYSDRENVTTNAFLYRDYLVKYLGTIFFFESVFVGAPLLESLDGDGVYPGSSSFPQGVGLFLRVTPKEYFEGWKDFIGQYVDPGFTHYGVLGQQWDNHTSRDNDADRNLTKDRSTRNTGLDDVSKVNNWVKQSGLTSIRRRDDFIGGKCSDAYTTKVLKDQATCFIWKDGRTINIVGTEDGEYFPPLEDGELTLTNYKTVQSTRETFEVFYPSLGRMIELERSGERMFKGVRAETYTLSKRSVQRACNGPDDTDCSQENVNYYMTHGDGLWPSERANEGERAVVGPPYFLYQFGSPRQDIRKCIDAPDWPSTYDEESHGISLFVEPITGITIGTHSHVQISLPLSKSVFDSGMYDNIFNFTGCETIYIPLYYYKGENQLSSEDAKRFTDIYDQFDAIEGGRIAAFVLCGCCFLFSLCLAGLFWKSNTRSSAPQEKSSEGVDTSAGGIVADDKAVEQPDNHNNRPGEETQEEKPVEKPAVLV